MADSRGMQDLFGLDIDKLAKGFGVQKYNFLQECQVRKMKGDTVRWFQKTAGTMSVATPSATSNVGIGSRPATLEQSWTRNTSTKKKYFVEGMLDEEDITDAEIDTFATTIRDLTEVILRDRDVDIWNIMSQDQVPGGDGLTAIQTFAVTAVGGDQWDAAAGAADPIKDFNRCTRMLLAEGYNPAGATMLMDERGYESLINWIISSKGSSIPNFSSEKIKTGIMTQLLNFNIKVSINVTTDFALAIIPKKAVTYSESQGIRASTTLDPGKSRNIRIWASGIAYRTDPLAIVLLTDINTT